MKASYLGSLWPIEFDKTGMVKSRRMPLDYAGKILVKKGNLDRNGKAVREDGITNGSGGYTLYVISKVETCINTGLTGNNKLTSLWYFDKDFRCVF